MFIDSFAVFFASFGQFCELAPVNPSGFGCFFLPVLTLTASIDSVSARIDTVADPALSKEDLAELSIKVNNVHNVNNGNNVNNRNFAQPVNISILLIRSG